MTANKNNTLYRLIVDGRLDNGAALTLEQAVTFKAKNDNLDIEIIAEADIPAYAEANGINLDELD